MNQRPITVILLAAALLFCESVSPAFAQTIRGKVTDSSNQPLPGAAVYFKETTVGVTTDAEGNYSITNKGNNKVLVFSFVGMKEKEVETSGKSVINVVLYDDTTFLDEAVSIGYTTVQRRDLLGSVASATTKDITQTPVLNFTEALTGKMAGVGIRASEGDPDSPVEIRVRGTGSITQSSEPLYIVDGFPVSDINDLSPNDIKSIDVLKDAFSTAIYGSRGAYGVVLITTKEGASGKVSLSYDGYFGIKKMANADALEMMTPYQYARYTYETSLLGNADSPTGGAGASYVPNFGVFSDMDLYKDYQGNDWKNMIFGNTGTTMSHNVNLSGSGGKTRWSASYSNLKEDAIMMNSSYLRHNIALKGSTSPVKNLSFSFSTRWSNTRITGAGANSINDLGTTAGNGRLINALRYSPIPMDYLKEMDDYDIFIEGYGANPIRLVTDNDDRRTRDQWNLNGAATWTIIPNLKLKADIGMDSRNASSDRYYGLSSYFSRSSAVITGKPAMLSTTSSSRTVRTSAVLSYDFKELFRTKKHKMDALLGAEYMTRTSNTESTLAEGFPDSFTAEKCRVFRGSAELIASSNNLFDEDEAMLSFFGRANYTLLGRYSVSAALRADESSKFASGNRWGIFPSAAVSWDIANENWLKHSRKINQLKLRYSIGAAGNNRIPAGQTRLQYTNEQDYRLDGITNLIVPNEKMPNKDLKWEKTISHNLGLDFAFFKTRLSGTVELYHNTTNDLLINFPTSGIGYSSQYRNLGSVLNEGVEVSLRGIIVERKNFGLNISGNIALNRNRVLKLGVDEIQTESRWCSTGVGVDYIVREGEPLGNVYGYLQDGFYQVDDFTSSYNSSGILTWKLKDGQPVAPSSSVEKTRPGTPKFKDINNDGEINEHDKVLIGNTLPVGTGGFAINMNLYGFDLNAAFNFSFGNSIYNANAAELSEKGRYTHKNLLSKYTPGNAFTNVDWATGEYINDPETLKEVNAGAQTWTPGTVTYFLSDAFIEDGSFLRLGSVTLGYTLPQALTGLVHIKKLRIYCTGSNLFCLTRYSGYDPEVNTRRGTCLTPGVDYSAYPKSIGVIGGLNITF